MCIKRYSLLMILLYGVFVSGVSGQSFSRITDLQDDWLIYDEAYQTYVPYVEGSYESLHLWIDIRKFKAYRLSFNAGSGTSVFVNGRLFKVIRSSGLTHVPLNDFQPFHADRNVLITFYNPDKQLPYDNISITANVPAENIRQAGLNIVERKPSDQNTFVFMIFIAFLATVAVLKHAFPRRFREMTSFRRFFQSYITEEQSAPFSLFSSTGSLALLFCCGSTALIYVSMDLPENDNEYGQLYLFLSSAILIFVFFIGKYLLIKTLVKIFNIGALKTIHFQETLRVAFLYMLILLPFFAIIRFSNLLDLEFSYIDFFYILLVFFFIMLLRLMFLIFTLSNFRNIYLFSYLCLSEILPLLIILKIILVVQ